MQAGHAIYGGYKREASPTSPGGVAYADALDAAQTVLR